MLHWSSRRIKRTVFESLAGVCLKSKGYSRPTNLLGSSTNLTATQLKKRSKTAQSNRAQAYVAHFWKNHHIIFLLLGN